MAGVCGLMEQVECRITDAVRLHRGPCGSVTIFKQASSPSVDARCQWSVYTKCVLVDPLHYVRMRPVRLPGL